MTQKPVPSLAAWQNPAAFVDPGILYVQASDADTWGVYCRDEHGEIFDVDGGTYATEADAIAAAEIARDA